MTRSLRRRRTPPKKNSNYSVDDIVEVERHGNILQGRLAQLLTEGTSPNPRWLVKFDGQPQKDEELYERSFGRLLATSEGDLMADRRSIYADGAEFDGVEDDGSEKLGVSTAAEAVLAAATTTTIPPTASAVMESPIKSEDGTNDDKSTTMSSPEGGSDDSDDGSGRKLTASERASAREQRSKRRQAKIEVDVSGSEDNNVSLQTDGGPSISDAGASGPKRKRRGRPHPNQLKKRSRLSSTDSDGGEIVKVKLLTGTLYLYKGRNRRAEFVRRL